MTAPSRLPRLARWLLRLSPVPPGTRQEVEGDLLDLFAVRRGARGSVVAHLRLYRDVVSLWRPWWPDAPHYEESSPTGRLREISVDLRHAARLFARQRAVLVLTITGLALGLGIATAAFSVINAAVVRGEGLVDPDRAPLVLQTAGSTRATAWRSGDFEHLRRGASGVSVEAVLSEAASVRTNGTAGEASQASIAFVSDGFFAAVGARVSAGRLLGPADERYTEAPPVVVSFRFWSTALDRDPDAVGRSVRIGRTDATIVGVAARGFSLPGARQLWLPLTAYDAVYDGAPTSRPPDVMLQVFTRLPPQMAAPRIEAQLGAVAATLPRGAATTREVGVALDSRAGLGREQAASVSTIALFVFAAIALVLVLACANVATLLVAIAITREREIGTRAALGATRARIVRQLVTESVALGIIAAALGLLVAAWSLPVIGRLVEAPPGMDFAPDLNVYLFVSLAAVVTGIGAGLAPVWHSRGVDLLTALKGGGARHHTLAPRRMRGALVATQAAAAVVLVVLATLFVRASARAAALDVGFDATGLYALSASPGRAFEGEDGLRTFWARALSEVDAVPGVAGVTLTEVTPFGDAYKSSVAGDGPGRLVTYLNRTRPEYFATLGLPIRSGRVYTPDEVRAGAPVALVSASLARKYWGDRSPLGEVMPAAIPLPPSAASLLRGGKGPSPRPVIIGVVGDAITAELHRRNALAVYEPLDPGSEQFARMLIREAPGAAGVMTRVRRRLLTLDPQAELAIASVAAQLGQEVARPRALATLAASVGIVAIALCVIGLYGLTASLVGQRTHEMGVRVAMGAGRGDLLRLLLWDSLRPVVLGIAIGVGGALLAARVAIASFLFGISPNDPIAFAGAAALLLTAALVAAVFPARRAARADAAFVLKGS